MAVRNFWIEADIDGRETMLSGGPKSKSGGMTISLYQRAEGIIANDGNPVLTIECYENDGELVTEVHDKIEKYKILILKTER